MHISAEGAVVVADIVEPCSHGDVADSHIRLAQQLHAHADAVEIDVFHR